MCLTVVPDGATMTGVQKAFPGYSSLSNFTQFTGESSSTGTKK